MKKGLLILSLGLGLNFQANAQTDSTQVKKEEVPAPVVHKNWYESISIRGYAQVRYNGLLQTNDKLGCEQCDKSWGGESSFFIRRMRIIFSGQVAKNVYFYVQPDFASAPSSSSGPQHFVQLRDAYFDVGVDKDNEFRFRIGQSKVPYGFENMQSSQNRLPLDRADGTNSAVSNERDLGVFFYWAPKEKRTLYSDLIKQNLKGSGDYGCFALGVYNGQTANQLEGNKGVHVVSRFSYPIAIGNQLIEPGIQAYTGDWVMPTANLTTNTDPKKAVKINTDKTYLDQRVAATFVLYPKPFGIQAEYNIGKGPEFNVTTDSIEVQKLSGGYVTLSYKTEIKGQTLIPFTRYQFYDGGKKHEKDARSYHVKELEIGVEWQPYKQFELVAMYTMAERRYEDMAKQNNLQKGRLVRLQAQVNF
jgi:phosphate-selective porin